MKDAVAVFAPATVANVACAFDVLGFAVSAPGDEVRIRRVPAAGVRICSITGDGGRLPLEAEKNTAGVAVLALLKHLGSNAGMEIEICKKMPLGSGLGSSAASAAAGVYAANLLLGEPLSARELLPFAMEAERTACGAAHADNVGPALLGGFVLVRSYSPLDVVQIAPPPDLYCSLIHPVIEVRTADARKILKKEIPLRDAVVQWGNVAGLIAGLLTRDYALIGRSLQDVIIEPVRSLLIPGFSAIKQAAIEAGALGCSLSGSGPSIFALCDSEQKAQSAAAAMKAAFSSINVDSQSYVSPINSRGPQLLEAE